MRAIGDITFIKAVPEGLGIRLEYTNIPQLDNLTITKVILERYEIPKSLNLIGLKQAIEEQTVQVHIGTSTSFVSRVFSLGGGDVGVEAKLIDITKAWQKNYPMIVDSGLDEISYIYLYRIITYALPNYELATRYVTRVSGLDSLITNENFRDYEYIKFLDRKDFTDISVNGINLENYEGIIKWINGDSIFHDTYRLRKRGEIESYKFTKYYQSAWMADYFIDFLTKLNTNYSYTLSEGLNGLYT